jgi:hypothetical protein
MTKLTTRKNSKVISKPTKERKLAKSSSTKKGPKVKKTVNILKEVIQDFDKKITNESVLPEVKVEVKNVKVEVKKPKVRAKIVQLIGDASTYKIRNVTFVKNRQTVITDERILKEVSVNSSFIVIDVRGER